MNKVIDAIQRFINDWTDSPEQSKKAFVHLKAYLASKPGVRLDFHARPGITYSLRAVHRNQTDKPLFVLVDVIDDQPRWLSVCFYDGMIQDPDEKGVFIPQGILGEDAICFDLEQYRQDEIEYLEARLDEACQSAAP